MTAKIEGTIPEGTEVSDDKRFFLPGLKISDVCPSCGCRVTMKLCDDYLSYPMINTVWEQSLGECLCGGTEEHECYAEIVVPIKMTIGLTVEGESRLF